MQYYACTLCSYVQICIVLNAHYYTNTQYIQEQMFASAERTSTTSADKFK